MHCREDSDGEQRSSRAAWAVTSIIGIALSGVISVSVPFFDVIVAAIGALGDLAAAYALPALFVLVRPSHFWRRVQMSLRYHPKQRNLEADFILCDLLYPDLVAHQNMRCCTTSHSVLALHAA